MTSVPRELFEDLSMGFHSNIPPCCVLAFSFGDFLREIRGLRHKRPREISSGQLPIFVPKYIACWAHYHLYKRELVRPRRTHRCTNYQPTCTSHLGRLYRGVEKVRGQTKAERHRQWRWK